MVNRIREMREKSKIKQIDLANHLNVSQGTLSNWESGKYDIDNASLIKLAKYFDCTTDYILSVDNAALDSPKPMPPTNKKPATESDGLTEIKKDFLNDIKNLSDEDIQSLQPLVKNLLKSRNQ